MKSVIMNMKAILFVIITLVLTSCFEEPSGRGLWKYEKHTPLTNYKENRIEAKALRKARELVEKGKHEEAIDYFLTAKKKYPDHPEILLELGLAYYALKRFEDAKNEFIAVITANPKVARGHMHLGRVYFMQKDLEKAEKLWIKAVEVNPKLWDAYYHLIKYYFYLGDAEKMKQYLVMLKENGGEVSEDVRRVITSKPNQVNQQ